MRFERLRSVLGSAVGGLALLASLAVAGPHAADSVSAPAAADLTFFGWSDQHVRTDGDGAHLQAAIDAMNRLPGTPYPEPFGGTVARPAFVFGCGDMTEWPTVAARNTYAELVTRWLEWPSFDILGNHDEGGKEPVATMRQWITERHGSLSYTFDRGGVHFVALYSPYDESLNNPAQPLAREALDFLRNDLAQRPAGTPVVVGMHLCLDALTNRDEFVNALGKANVVMVLTGHYHRAQVDRYRDRVFVQLPSPAPNGEREVMVVRFQSGRLLALPFNYQTRQWVTSPRKRLDLAPGQ